MRVFLSLLASIISVAPVFGQTVKDTAIATGGTVHEEPFFLSDEVVKVSWGDTLRVLKDTTVEVTGENKKYFRVTYSGKGGWISGEDVMTDKERQEYEKTLDLIGESRLAEGGALLKRPGSSASRRGNLYQGDTVEVLDVSKKHFYFKVRHDGKTGWLRKRRLMTQAEQKEYERTLASLRDTVVVRGGRIKYRPESMSGTKVSLSRGDTVRIIGKSLFHYRVGHDGKQGWLRQKNVMSDEEEKSYEREVEARRRRVRERREYFRRLRDKGFGIVLTRQTFTKNSADGISLGLGLVNISRSKTIKYVNITWKLFNPVGDPTAGQNTGRATAQTRLVGPIKPGGTAYTEFENVWYNSVGSCAEIRGIVVEHIDGSSFTYIDDLKDIAREAKSARLMGDCSYKAQQERKK